MHKLERNHSKDIERERADFLKTKIGKLLLETNKDRNISFTWSGGDDEGWGSLEIDGKKVKGNDPIAEKICDRIFNVLDYGSFAGDFGTEGTLDFDTETLQFKGIDYYTSKK